MKDVGHGSLLTQGSTRKNGWINHANDPVGMERIEAFFAARAYEMHRHDTYAIGRTLSGVQSFNYRGALRNNQPGGTMVLHPDEKHDGQAGAEGGFHYRIAYIEPAAIQAVLRGRALPYVNGGISDDPRLFAATGRILRSVEDRIDTFEYQDALFELAHALEAASGSAPVKAKKLIDYSSVEMARQYLQELPQAVTLDDLEKLCGRDRWSLSRDFRTLFGTSPYRYLTMRRLDAVKTALRSGQSLAETAFSTGFADQSHMTRQFTKAFGISPARWLGLLNHRQATSG